MSPLEVGDRMPVRSFGPLTRVDIARFAGASGDFNPLHLDDEVARAAGFDTVIAMGQLHAGVLAGAVSDWVGVTRVRRFEVRYASPFALGETLDVAGRVTAVDDGLARVELSGSAGERIILTGVADVSAS